MLLNDEEDHIRREWQRGYSGLFRFLGTLFGIGMQVKSDYDNLVVHKADTAARKDLEDFAKSLLENSQAIPLQARYGHTHIVGGSGHGKTQLLQQSILDDLELVRKGERTVVVVDSQGDMISNLLHSSELPEDRLVLIDPTDIDNPPALNLFDFGLSRLSQYDAADRVKLRNGALSLYEYLFGALLRAELTQRQDVIFTFLAKLMMGVPGGTIHTLREFVKNPESTRRHLHKLDNLTQEFFNTEFYGAKYDNTRQQILTRLWGVLANQTLEQMFASPQNKVDLFSAMNRGSVILVNTAKDFLKTDSELFGRFFIALLAQAVEERAALPKGERMSTFIYIDEAHEYFNGGNIILQGMINSARKQNVGLILAHQNLDQLNTALRATVMASTAVKMVGGLSASDADKFAREMECEPEFLRAMRKQANSSQFASFVRNHTPRPMPHTVAFGALERRPKRSQDAYDRMIAQNRQRYAGRPAASATPVTGHPTDPELV